MLRREKTEEIRALTIKQPYASLMLYDKFETRKWKTAYRGIVLICAGKKDFANEELPQITRDIISFRKLNLNGLWNYSGHAIAIGRLIDCRPMLPEDEAKCFYPYSPDLYCHVYVGVQRIEPFPYKGGLGLRKLEDEYIGRIKPL